MFKITQNTLRDFTLAEVLLMAAMNQLEAKRNFDASERSLRDTYPFHAKAAWVTQSCLACQILLAEQMQSVL